jgi:hypothetical protein
MSPSIQKNFRVVGKIFLAIRESAGMAWKKVTYSKILRISGKTSQKLLFGSGWTGLWTGEINDKSNLTFGRVSDRVKTPIKYCSGSEHV